MNLTTGHTDLIVNACREYGCLRNQAAYILATAWHETQYTMHPVKEAFSLSENWRKQNLRYYPWYGRGFVQLTWEENYKKAQRLTGYKVHDNPDLAMDPDAAAHILVRGSMEGWFTGKRVQDYVTIKNSDFRNARRVINGMDCSRKIARHAVGFDDLLKASGY